MIDASEICGAWIYIICLESFARLLIYRPSIRYQGGVSSTYQYDQEQCNTKYAYYSTQHPAQDIRIVCAGMECNLPCEVARGNDERGSSRELTTEAFPQCLSEIGVQKGPRSFGSTPRATYQAGFPPSFNVVLEFSTSKSCFPSLPLDRSTASTTFARRHAIHRGPSEVSTNRSIMNLILNSEAGHVPHLLACPLCRQLTAKFGSIRGQCIVAPLLGYSYQLRNAVTVTAAPSQAI